MGQMTHFGLPKQSLTTSHGWLRMEGVSLKQLKNLSLCTGDNIVYMR